MTIEELKKQITIWGVLGIILILIFLFKSVNSTGEDAQLFVVLAIIFEIATILDARKKCDQMKNDTKGNVVKKLNGKNLLGAVALLALIIIVVYFRNNSSLSAFSTNPFNTIIFLAAIVTYAVSFYFCSLLYNLQKANK